jgi:hypothetical protein
MARSRVARLVSSAAVVGIAIAGCASSKQAAGPAHAQSRARDARLVGTWRAEQAAYRGAVTNADAATYEYLVLGRRGSATLYDGDTSESYTWATHGHRLLLQQPDGEYFSATAFRSSAAARISTAVDYVTSSPRITYAVTGAGKITLSGTARFYKGTLADPSASPTAPPLTVTASVTYARVAGPPPAPGRSCEGSVARVAPGDPTGGGSSPAADRRGATGAC